MRHTKNSHNSALFHTLSHYARHHTPSSGAYTQDSLPQPISISHFFAPTEHRLPRAAAGFLTSYHSTHAYAYTQYTRTLTLYTAAGPIVIWAFLVLLQSLQPFHTLDWTL